MSCGCQTCGQTLCGCCAGATRLTPALIVNRSLLPAISYRVGTYSSFMQTMLAALSSSNVPALTGLRTRDSSDFSIALVDAWSEVLDILTFYTERLANEAYLGTAVEARSVFELVKLVGYTPSPGVSASTTLVFTLATSPGSPATVPIPQGTRVQSVPGPGQTPQVFETSADLTATIAANAIPAATTQPWTTTGKDTSTWIAGTANNIQVGNALLFISASGGAPSITGPAILCFVTAVVIDPAEWEHANLLGPAIAVRRRRLLDLPVRPADQGRPVRRECAVAGDIPIRPGDQLAWNFVPPNIPGYPTNPSNDWSFTPTGSATINLDNSYPGLNPAGGASASAAQAEWAVLKSPGSPASIAFFQIQSASESNPAMYTVSAKTTQLTMASGAAIVPSSPANTDVSSLLSTFVNNTRKTTVYVGSQLLTFANLPLTAWTPSPTGDYAATLMPGMLAPVSGGSLRDRGAAADWAELSHRRERQALANRAQHSECNVYSHRRVERPYRQPEPAVPGRRLPAHARSRRQRQRPVERDYRQRRGGHSLRGPQARISCSLPLRPTRSPAKRPP